ncbi:MAG: hypothetical protein R3A52_00970 [Polyangiales bacterium]
MRPELPAALEGVVLRAMARDPRDRFPSLRAFAAALLPFASERSRQAWGTTFAPDGSHGPGDTQLEVAAAPAPLRGDAADTFTASERAATQTAPSSSGQSGGRRWLPGLVAAAVLSLGAVSLWMRPPPRPSAPLSPRASTTPEPPPPEPTPTPPVAPPAPVAAAEATPESTDAGLVAGPVTRPDAPRRAPARRRSHTRRAPSRGAVPDLPP